MADFENIIKNHTGEDGSIPADAIAKLVKAISTAVGNEFVEKTRYKAKLEEIDTLKGEKQTAEDNATTAEKWKKKYDALKGEFDSYKETQTAKETKTAKEKAVRAYYESKNITGKSLDIAMRGSAAEIDAVELENGKIKDASALDELIGGTFSGLVSQTTVTGAKTDTPPANNHTESHSSGRAAQIAAEYQKARYGEIKTEKTGGE